MFGSLRNQHTSFTASLSFLFLVLLHVPLAMAAPAVNAAAATADGPQNPINVATVNVRYDVHAANPVPIPKTGAITPKQPPANAYDEQPWAVRRSRLVDQLLSGGHLDIIGFQEVLHNQMLDLEKLLGSNYKSYGVGRNDGAKAGEYSPIFFDQTRFDMVDSKTIWLAPDTTKPGEHPPWDAGQVRIATILSLKDKAGGYVHAVCTHYDDRGVQARAESSLIIRKEIRKWIVKVEGKVTGSPVLLFGDFNSPDNEDGYKNIVSTKPIDGSAFAFQDAYTQLVTRGQDTCSAQSCPYGPKNTYTGFKPPGDPSVEATRIDFVMLGTTDQGKPTKWAFSKYAVIDNFVHNDSNGWTGLWSDHRAVRATVKRVSAAAAARSKPESNPESKPKSKPCGDKVAEKRTLNINLKLYK